MKILRKEYATIKARLKEPRRRIQIVMGPRQVGKTTTVQQVYNAINTPKLFFSADDVPSTQPTWISDCWQAARMMLKNEDADELLLVIDEIQKIKGWSETVKKEWDRDTLEDRNIKVLLLGSSRILLERGLADSLAGRFEIIKMAHWDYEEMHEAFDYTIEQYIYFGAYPGAADIIADEKRWSEYIQAAIVDATINKDILMNTIITKPALLRQTFELAASYSGEILSITKMLCTLQDAGNSTTLSGYLNLLDESGLVCGLQKYSTDKARRRASVPKYQVYNNALRNIYAESDFKESMSNPRIWGRMYESAIGAHIVNQAYLGHYNAHYWNDGIREVDFVLTHGTKLAAIEVKSNNDTNNAGLALFSTRYNPTTSFVVGPNGVPITSFLSAKEIF